MNPIVKINNVSVAFRENTALKGISLEIPEKSFFSVIGPNGAGKTTLLTVINGLGNILSGSLKVFGEEFKTGSRHKIRSRIGYVPQHLSIDARSPISVKEAVSIGRYGKKGLMGKWDEKDAQAVIEAARVVGIEHLLDKPIGHLSGGEHQKVSIARALAQEPEIILLDEPTSNLDPKAQNEIVKLIEQIYLTQKYTLVFVTHILSHIPSVCSDIVLLKSGKIVYSGNAKDGLDERKLSDLYECKVKVSTVDGKRHYHIGSDHV